MELKDYLINRDIVNKAIITDDTNNLYKIIRSFVFKNNNLYDTKLININDLAKNIVIEHKLKNNDLKPLKVIDRNICVSLIEEVIKENKLDFIFEESYSIDTFNEVLRIINIIRNNKVNDYSNKRISYIKR